MNTSTILCGKGGGGGGNLCYYRMESTVCRKTGGPNPLRTIIRILSCVIPGISVKIAVACG